jgi:3-isopropylmalate dehydrogenase
MNDSCPGAGGPAGRLTGVIPGWSAAAQRGPGFVLGVLRGEGVGPEVIDGAMELLAVASEVTPYRFELRFGGDIGLSAERATGQALTAEVETFCRSVFADGGTVLCGPGGSRFVYELRERFDLYCKLIPIRPLPCLRDTGVFRSQAVDGVDVLIVRENAGGIYFGESGVAVNGQERRAFHHFHYDETQVRRLLTLAVGIAATRRGRLCVVHKPAGIPAISRLWSELAEALCADAGIDLELLEVDTANYRLLVDAAHFDVVAASNLFGDVLADGAAALLASRGMSYSGNFADGGVAVYQTAHGAAYDIAGQDRANPLGQIFSLAMLLRESFGLLRLSEAVLAAVTDALAAGWRTADIAVPGGRVVGTAEMSRRVAECFRARCELLDPEFAHADLAAIS